MVSMISAAKVVNFPNFANNGNKKAPDLPARSLSVAGFAALRIYRLFHHNFVASEDVDALVELAYILHGGVAHDYYACGSYNVADSAVSLN